MIIQSIRSLIFYALFFAFTTVLAVPFGIYSIFAPKMSGFWVVKLWYTGNMFFLRWVVGIKSEITGQENLPAGSCVLASKHMSDWDIFALLPATNGKPTFISKKELLNIPFFGWCMRNFHTVSIDRKNGKSALPQLVEQGSAAIERGCRIVIYPEGTRRKPFDVPKYKWGLAKLYVNLDVPVVPVALTSGLYWPRNSLILWPGTARAKYLEPIPPGLEMEEFQAILSERIEAETTKMMLEDVDMGITHPISEEFQGRIDANRS